jgi:AraC-like DNA-binding protein
MLYILMIGTLQSLLASYFVSADARKNKADTYLATFLICLCVHFFSSFLFLLLNENFFVTRPMTGFLFYAYAPLILLYAKRLNKPDASFADEWLLFIPAMLLGAAYFWVMGLAMGKHPMEQFYIELYNKVVAFTLPIFSGFLLYKAFRMASQFTEKQKHEQVMIKRIMTVFLVLMAGFFFFAIYVRVTDLSYTIANVIARSTLYTGMLLLCLTIIIYKWSLRERKPKLSLVASTGGKWQIADIFQLPGSRVNFLSSQSFSIVPSMAGEEEKELLPAPEKELIRPSLLSPEKQKAIYMMVEEIVQSKKLFLDEDFNLDKLAAATNIQRQYISEALNQYAQKSFYQFINGYRVAAVIAKMEQLKHQAITINLTILAFDCGFKSKAPFNQYFKKHTGLTPSEYMQRLKEQEKVKC